MLRRMPQITSLQRRSTVAGLLAMVAAHGVQLADTADIGLAQLETQTVRAIWGPTRPSRAMEVVFSLLPPGHCTSPVMRTKYERLVWMAQLGPHAGHVGMQGCTPAAWARRTRGPHGQAPGMGPPRGMVALVRPGAGRAAGPRGRGLGLVAAPHTGVAVTGGHSTIRGVAATDVWGAGGDH